MVKALTEQIPLSNDDRQGQIGESITPRGDSHARLRDGLYARVRRLEARMSAIESTLSALRRDVNRIDRANYRKAGVSESNHPPVPARVPQYIGGIEL